MPIWHDDRLIADETVDYGHGDADAQALHHGARRASCASTPQHAIPAYEDVWYYLWKERRLPVNVDPLKSRAEGRGGARAAGARLRARARPRRRLRAAAARVTPSPDAARWASGLWFLRAEHLFLIPGDSPIGYRLPLDSLPWVGAGRLSRPSTSRICTSPRPPLPPRQPAVRGGDRDGRRRAGSGRRGRIGADRAAARRLGDGHRPDGALRRAAPRPAARVHAAGERHGGLSRSGRRDRGHGRVAGDARDRRRHAAAARSAARTTSR